MIIEALAVIGLFSALFAFSCACAFLVVYDFKVNDRQEIPGDVYFLFIFVGLPAFLLFIEIEKKLQVITIDLEKYQDYKELEKSSSYYIGKEVGSASK